jgi:hypothetical protein
MSTLRQKLVEFLKYLQKNSSMFTTAYEEAGAEYLKRSEQRYGVVPSASTKA